MLHLKKVSYALLNHWQDMQHHIIFINVDSFSPGFIKKLDIILIRINHKKLLRMMRELGIQGRIKRKYVTTTNSQYNNRIYPNLLKDKIITGINQIWCADITYIRRLNGFVYLAAIIDAYSCKIVGALGKTLCPKLTVATTRRLLKIVYQVWEENGFYRTETSRTALIYF